MSTNTPKTIGLSLKEDLIEGVLHSTLHEEWDSSGYPEKRGGDLLRTDDETFLPALGKYVRGLVRKYPSAIITVKGA